MKIEFDVSCLGFTIGGYGHFFEMEIEEWETVGMVEKEREDYIQKRIYDYILENIEYEYEIK